MPGSKEAARLWKRGWKNRQNRWVFRKPLSHVIWPRRLPRRAVQSLWDANIP